MLPQVYAIAKNPKDGDGALQHVILHSTDQCRMV